MATWREGSLEAVDDIDFDAPIPWPSPDDDLFGRGSGHWRAVADVQGLWGSHTYVYGTGYREAAEILVKHRVAQTAI